MKQLIIISMLLLGGCAHTSAKPTTGDTNDSQRPDRVNYRFNLLRLSALQGPNACSSEFINSFNDFYK